MYDTTRIESLETQVRTLKRMLFGVFALVVAGGLLAATSLQSVPNVIKAKKFEVVNDEGTAILHVEKDHNGIGGIRICNSESATLARLGGSKLGGGLRTYGYDGRRRVTIGGNHLGGHIEVSNKNSHVVEICAASGGGSIRLRSIKGDTYVKVYADDDGGQISISDGSVGARHVGIYTTKQPFESRITTDLLEYKGLIKYPGLND